MPRIRKKTSKRGTTDKREKIKDKVRESRKKAKKEAKRNPQWKSRKPKDPGIPNNFPFKEQILAEVAEQRRKADEEKAARKDAKKALKAQAHVAIDEGSGSEDEVDVADLSAMTLTARTTTSSSKIKAKSAEPEKEEVPALLNPDLPNLRAVVSAADVVVQVLDARDPQSYLCTPLDHLAISSGKKAIYVLNKIDTVPRESLAAWAAHLRQRQPTFYFRSASAFLPSPENATPTTKPKSKEPADDAIGAKAILALLTKWATEQPEGTPLTVAVVGIANTGKSAFVSSLARRAASPIYRPPPLSAPSTTPTTTPYPIEVPLDIATASRTIRLIDVPGLSFAPGTDVESTEVRRAADVLLRSKGRIDRMKNPVPPIAELVARANQTDLMLFYGLPAYSKDDPEAFLTTVARVEKLTKKGGSLDLPAAARLVLRDWATGKLPRSAVAPKIGPVPAEGEVFIDDEKTLANVLTRAERRRAGGIVRLSSGTVDVREPNWDAPWIRDSRARDDEAATEETEDLAVGPDQDQDEEDDDEAGDDEAGDEEEGDGDEEEPPLPSPPPVKRKRKADPLTTSAPAPKKVAFSKVPAGPSVQATSMTKEPPKSALKAKPKTSVAEARRKLTAAKMLPATKGKAVTAKPKTSQVDGGQEDGAYVFGEFF